MKEQNLLSFHPPDFCISLPEGKFTGFQRTDSLWISITHRASTAVSIIHLPLYLPPSMCMPARFLKSIGVPAKKEEGMKFLTVFALRGHRRNLKNDLFVKGGQKAAREKGGWGGRWGPAARVGGNCEVLICHDGFAWPWCRLREYIYAITDESFRYERCYFFFPREEKKNLKDKEKRKIKRFPKVARQRFSYHSAVRF